MIFNKKKKISIIGAGNAGIISALHTAYYGKDLVEVTLYYDPTIPIERVGQGSLIPTTGLICRSLGINWINNPIDATFKTGILYEGWGKKKNDYFHAFDLNGMAMHYIPQKLSQVVLESGLVKVVEKNIKDPEKEVDGDYIIDCRGRDNKNEDNYESLVNPLNSVLLCNKPGADPNLYYTRTVATPNGWTFVVPNRDSVSYGYLYNKTITTKEEAEEDFVERFDIPEIDGRLSFKNYIAKDAFVGERTMLNGNRLGFVEPLEATSLGFYHEACKIYLTRVVEKWDKLRCNMEIRKDMMQIQRFILWHYQKGSKYDTPFWKYAQSLSCGMDEEFRNLLKKSRRINRLDAYHLVEHHRVPYTYAQWTIKSIKQWNEYVS
tara:strand:+ start:36 stop:1166 length:1131 start_codon:yes stop_codon:yes gene_type:complete